MTLLKDAASAAIYGTRDANGDSAANHSGYPNKFTQAQIDLYSNPNRDKSGVYSNPRLLITR